MSSLNTACVCCRVIKKYGSKSTASFCKPAIRQLLEITREECRRAIAPPCTGKLFVRAPFREIASPRRFAMEKPADPGVSLIRYRCLSRLPLVSRAREIAQNFRFTRFSRARSCERGLREVYRIRSRQDREKRDRLAAT